jgi:hypothetical protein
VAKNRAATTGILTKGFAEIGAAPKKAHDDGASAPKSVTILAMLRWFSGLGEGVGQHQEASATLLDLTVGLELLCFDLMMAADRRQACDGFRCSKGRYRGWVFIGDELDMRC